ncbi:High-affinity branched-chain amino acid transport system permease protein LivH (TC 3.A.1.4.1) [Olavius algarvensis associated proteobacterium Delta 3]|nr:High-affinity branched-chain amino acid transport system permease protein LivH (TC 3.A.1.4.1) [Olavius algarvensis associated proteobacterium Delta 3]
MSILVIMSMLNGLTLAALLFITASGLTLSFSLMRVVNLTHGALYMAGGFIGMSVVKVTGSWLLAMLSGGGAMAVVALLEERFLLRRARGDDLRETLISLSVAIIIGDLVLVIWGGYPKSIAIPPLLSGVWTIPVIDMVYPVFRIFMLGLAIFIIVALWLFLTKTNLGITIRAGVDNFDMVSSLGINVRRLFTFVFGLSGFLAGVAGVLGGTSLMLVVGEDWRILTLTLIVIIIGGMGSLGGTIVGALITGLVYSFATAYIPEFSLFILFLPVAIILSIRPQGLFGTKA